MNLWLLTAGLLVLYSFYIFVRNVDFYLIACAEKVIGWLNSAAENDCFNPLIFTKLGELLDLSGKPQYKRKAYELYHRAVEMGDTEAKINLAEMYRCGVEGVVNEDIKEAFEWYKKAAGEAADFNAEDGAIGRLRVVTLNAVKGNEARQTALKLLFKYYLDGDCPEGRPQPTKAVYYLTRAAEMGDTEAQLELGEIYLNGSCEQMKDVSRAKRWLGKASTRGNAVAKQVSSFNSRFGTFLYYLFACARVLARAQFFIVYEPIVSKLPNFACK